MVYFNNEYNLPPRFDVTDLIIDVGTHIGSFAFAALVRGAGKVICAEAHPDNIERARRHLADYITVGKVDLCHGAVWRSDVHQLVTVSDFPVHDSQLVNTGGATTYLADLPPYLEIIPLDDLISNAHIRLLKLDCEGAEFPILLTSHRLRQVQEIVGEYHEHEAYTMTLLEQHLLNRGFRSHIKDIARMWMVSGFSWLVGIFVQYRLMPCRGNCVSLPHRYWMM